MDIVEHASTLATRSWLYLIESVRLVQTMHARDLLTSVWPLIVIDIPHYTIAAWVSVVLARTDKQQRIHREAFRRSLLSNPPLVTVVVPAHNEEERLNETIQSLLAQSYPHLEIVIADDGSTDRTPEICAALKRENIHVVRADQRQGKAFGLNIGLLLARGEFLVFCDGDTTFREDAVIEVLLPFHDPHVAAVSGNIRVRNRSGSIFTRLQALEYLLSIEMGRRILARFDILHIVSGAFGAFRIEVVRRVGGWEVSPGEDADITKSLRKMGYRIEFAPTAVSLTDVPKTAKQLIRQRLRWGRSICFLGLRKHRDLLSASRKRRNFRWRNFVSAWDVILMNVVLGSGLFVMAAYLVIFAPHAVVPLIIIIAVLYTVLNYLQLLAAMMMTDDRREALRHVWVVPFFWFYLGFFLKAVTLGAVLDELLFRSSYRDSFVPPKVSKQKPRWGEVDPFIYVRETEER